MSCQWMINSKDSRILEVVVLFRVTDCLPCDPCLRSCEHLKAGKHALWTLLYIYLCVSYLSRKCIIFSFITYLLSNSYYFHYYYVLITKPYRILNRHLHPIHIYLSCCVCYIKTSVYLSHHLADIRCSTAARIPNIYTPRLADFVFIGPYYTIYSYTRMDRM